MVVTTYGPYGEIVEKRPDSWAPRPTYFKAETSKLGFIRWSRYLINADLPLEWKPIDIKLWLFLVSKLNLQAPHSYHRAPWREALEFCDCTKPELRDSLCRLVDHAIDLKDMDRPTISDYLTHPVFTVVQSCEFRNEENRTDIIGHDMCWVFHPHMITALIDLEDGYARVNLAAIRKLKSFAALRIYMIAALMNHSRSVPANTLWTPAEMCRLLGRPGMRIDNLKDRVIPDAISEIKAANGIDAKRVWTKVLYDRDPGRGRPIKSIRFKHFGDVWGS
jgi:hypothetical protein